jgi:hypothetical protein
MLTRRRFLGQSALAVLGLADAVWADGRTKERRPALTPDGRKAVDRALTFLAKAQGPDGSFGTEAYKGNVAVTALAGLAFLADGHLPGAGKHSAAVGKAVSYVLGQEQKEPTGFLHNAKGTPHGPMYGHAYGIQFLATVAGNDGNKERAARTRDTLRRATKLLVTCQNPEGGWRYTPYSRDADLSVTGNVALALRAAHDAGCEVPKATVEKAADYIKRCQDRTTGAFRYMAHGGPLTRAWARTALALAALQALGADTGKEFDASVAYLMQNLPKGAPGEARPPDLYFFYGHLYAARALSQIGGEAWARWYPAAVKELLPLQAENGSWKDPIDTHYATAAACLTLLASAC